MFKCNQLLSLCS